MAPTREAALREESDEPKVMEKQGGNNRPPVQGMTMGAPAPQASPRRIMVPAASAPSASVEKEILVVVSKVKDFIRARSEMNTSQSAMEVLSDFIRAHCEDAIQKAREEGRKTVLDRDFHWKT